MTVVDSDAIRLASIASRWTPTSPVPYGRKLPDGSIKRCSPAIFNRGDFVDVTAAIDIASIGRAPKDRKTNVHFSFTRVVRLLTGDELTEVSIVLILVDSLASSCTCYRYLDKPYRIHRRSNLSKMIDWPSKMNVPKNTMTQLSLYT